MNRSILSWSKETSEVGKLLSASTTLLRVRETSTRHRESHEKTKNNLLIFSNLIFSWIFTLWVFHKRKCLIYQCLYSQLNTLSIQSHAHKILFESCNQFFVRMICIFFHKGLIKHKLKNEQGAKGIDDGKLLELNMYNLTTWWYLKGQPLIRNYLMC